MKIILTDNYDRPNVADKLVYENLHPWIANWMVEEMRKREDHNLNLSGFWIVSVHDEYKLRRGMEDLV